MHDLAAPHVPSGGRARAASRWLLLAAALTAILAGGSALADLPGTTDPTAVPEIWRAIGLVTFGALFVVLAARPDHTALWLVVIGNKIALAVVGLVLVNASADSDGMELVVWDGGLVVLLLAAFGLSRR